MAGVETPVRFVVVIYKTLDGVSKVRSLAGVGRLRGGARGPSRGITSASPTRVWGSPRSQAGDPANGRPEATGLLSGRRLPVRPHGGAAVRQVGEAMLRSARQPQDIELQDTVPPRPISQIMAVRRG